MSNDYDKPTPHDTLKDFIPPTNDQIEEMKQKRIAKMKRLANGEPEPPSVNEGICRVCHGVVTTKYRRDITRSSWEEPTYGSRNNSYHYAATGISCNTCGIMYAFVPKSSEHSDEEG